MIGSAFLNFFFIFYDCCGWSVKEKDRRGNRMGNQTTYKVTIGIKIRSTCRLNKVVVVEMERIKRSKEFLQ